MLINSKNFGYTVAELIFSEFIGKYLSILLLWLLFKVMLREQKKIQIKLNNSEKAHQLRRARIYKFIPSALSRINYSDECL